MFDIHIKIDPLGISGLSVPEIFKICGPLPPWAFEAISQNLPLRQHMEQRYVFVPLFPIDGAKLDSERRMVYPGDPPLSPLLVIESETQTFIQYPHRLVCLIENGEPLFTRMD